ncbi:molybdopterin-dependent oxidoreductase [Vallitalea okinawensis]|uniref:molybdopterin-dependent oxidoreductase n=1 Tax=Vallitalea okinawensis TaxID=2078660 RepID=UPI000CFD0468|nr:molybdopterin-dependent oxidoreductase [Vallitalea okinawensis]
MKNKVVGIIMGIIIVCVVIFGILNARNLEARKAMQNDAELNIKTNGEIVKTYNLQALNELGMEDFQANLKKNGQEPVTYTYTGVLLKTVLEDAKVDLSQAKAVVATAVDGYSSAIALDKVLEENNVYIAVKREGEAIGNKEDGGDGPYQIIISKDPFSQYWCKWAIEVDVQ